MLTNKQCPKCGGNIYLSGDYYGRFEQCLQCGYIHDLDADNVAQKRVAKSKEQPVLV
jgi:DNA-directed RNA polymerase subunit M/transcription elongation factor TFIIS